MYSTANEFPFHKSRNNRCTSQAYDLHINRNDRKMKKYIFF